MCVCMCVFGKQKEIISKFVHHAMAVCVCVSMCACLVTLALLCSLVMKMENSLWFSFCARVECVKLSKVVLFLLLLLLLLFYALLRIVRCRGREEWDANFMQLPGRLPYYPLCF